MNNTTISPQKPSSTNPSPWLAIGSVAVLFVTLSVVNPDPIADEGGQHLHAIAQFYTGDWTLPDHLPMLPTYHAVAALCWQAFGPSLTVLRALNALLAVIAIVVFAAIIRRTKHESSADAVLHFAWLPILFPFMAMVYTEALSMLFIVLAVLMHVRRRFALSAAILLLACLVRQSNVVWVVFMAIWAVVQGNQAAVLLPPEKSNADAPAGRTRSATLMRLGIGRTWGHLIVVALAAAFFIYNQGPTLSMVEANRPRFNPAQLYLFALFIMFLWAPIWVARFHDDVHWLCRYAVRHRLVAAVALLLAAGVVLLLANVYDNPHPWNRNVNYIRNLPLVAMSNSLSVRLAVACLIMMVLPMVVRFTLAQPNCRMLGLVWLLSIAFILPHSLAEPRYYIVPALFLNLFTRYTSGQARYLTVWYAASSALIALFVGLYGNPDGGIW